MTATAAIFSRVQALVARAAHEGTPVEEARSSAVIACKLIHEHEMLATKFTASADDFPFSYRTPPTPAPAPAKRGRGRSRPWVDADDDSPIKLVSKYRGRCLACLMSYDVGETVWWRPHLGATHDGCKDDYDWP